MQKKYISIFCILLSIFALMCTAEAVDVYVSIPETTRQRAQRKRR